MMSKDTFGQSQSAKDSMPLVEPVRILSLAIGVSKNGGLYVIGLGADNKPYQWINGKWTVMK